MKGEELMSSLEKVLTDLSDRFMISLYDQIVEAKGYGWLSRKRPRIPKSLLKSLGRSEWADVRIDVRSMRRFRAIHEARRHGRLSQ